MKSNNKIREEIFKILENQINDNNPPETKAAFKRLKSEGYDDFAVKQMIGQCIAVEIFDVIKNGKPYDNIRYIRHLKALPEEPFD